MKWNVANLRQTGENSSRMRTPRLMRNQLLSVSFDNKIKDYNNIIINN